MTLSTMIQRIFYIALLFTPLSVFALGSVPSEVNVADTTSASVDGQLAPTVRHARTAEEIIIKLQRQHYKKRSFDDALSSDLFDNSWTINCPSQPLNVIPFFFAIRRASYFCSLDLNLRLLGPLLI